jgi:hypothetical protein
MMTVINQDVEGTQFMEFTLSIKTDTSHSGTSYLRLQYHYLDKIVLSTCRCTEQDLCLYSCQ